jgi:hypothetical protein
MSLHGTYDPQKHTITFGPIVVTGFADGTFLKAYRNEDTYSIKIGADGNGARIRNANRSGRMEFTLLASSPSNDLLQAQAQIDELTGGGVASAFVKDGSGTAKAHGKNAWIVKIPDLERAKELGEVTWIVETDILDVVQGGTTPIPGT